MSSAFLATSLRACMRDLLSHYPVALAYLFGSAASGRATTLSDVDIAIILVEEGLDPGSKLQLELEIEDELARNCGIGQVDVRVINDAPIMVRGEVITNGILLYSRDEDNRVEFETSTRSEYFDFMPIATMHRKVYFERLSQRGLND